MVSLNPRQCRTRNNTSEMDRPDLESLLLQLANQKLASGSITAEALPEGARLVDSWQNERFGGVLFWIDKNLDLHGQGTAVLHAVLLRHEGHDWRSMAAGGSGTGTAEELAAEKGPGLHKLGATSLAPVRQVRAFASPEVFAIELRSDRGIASRRPGLDGFCLIGVHHNYPITYAHAIDCDGRAIVGEPLLL